MTNEIERCVMSMTRRERVYATIRRDDALDAIPWQFDLTTAVIEKLETYYEGRGEPRVQISPRYFSGSAEKFPTHWREVLGDHIIKLTPKSVDDSPENLPEEYRRDAFGVVWRREARDYHIGEWGELVEYPLKRPSLEGYTFPEPLPDCWDHVPTVREMYPDRFLMASGFGLYEHGWAMCGFENYLSYIAGEPNFIEELTERLADYSIALTRQLGGLGCDGIRFSDDWGFQDRLMMRPATWRRIYKKHYGRIYEAGRDAGLVVMVHSCGNITSLLPDLVEIGVEVVHAFQPEAMDVTFCKREYGDYLTFWGGLGSQSTLPKGTPDDVRREVRDRIELFDDGGYILAPAGATPTETPAENVAAIVEVAEEQLRG
jgi:uroporphyrinogen decarboxylase